jgi:hypothetical protein
MSKVIDNETEFAFVDAAPLPVEQPRPTVRRAWRVNGVSPFLRVEHTLDSIGRAATFLKPIMSRVSEPWPDKQVSAVLRDAEALQQAYNKVQAYFVAPRERKLPVA